MICCASAGSTVMSALAMVVPPVVSAIGVPPGRGRLAAAAGAAVVGAAVGALVVAAAVGAGWAVPPHAAIRKAVTAVRAGALLWSPYKMGRPGLAGPPPL